MFCARLPGSQGNGQCATNRPHAAVQREFADGKDVCQMLGFREVAVRAKDSECDWQIETCAFLSHVSRRQIDGRFLKRKEEGTVVYSGANSFTRFPNRQVR